LAFSAAGTMPETLFQHLSCRQEDGILVLTFTVSQIQGDDVAELLRKEFLEALSQFGASKLILDFGRVQFITSTAFRPLLSLHRKLQELKGRMVFCNLADCIAEVFVVTRLISSTRSSTAPFEMAKDVADALARLRHFTQRTVQGVLVLTLVESKMHGDELADSLSQELLAAVTKANAGKVVLDFAKVEAITTPCMRPLLALRKHLRDQNGRLVLCNLQPMVGEVLTVTRLISPEGGPPAPMESAADLAAAIALLNS
jgi:anti-sigma B factor antagonist